MLVSASSLERNPSSYSYTCSNNAPTAGCEAASALTVATIETDMNVKVGVLHRRRLSWSSYSGLNQSAADAALISGSSGPAGGGAVNARVRRVTKREDREGRGNERTRQGESFMEHLSYPNQPALNMH